MYEYAGENLYEIVVNQSKSTNNDIFEYMKQIAQGLSHLHKRNYFYNDVKPLNIALKDNKITIIDLGSVERFDPNTGATLRYRDEIKEVTPQYEAPELVQSGNRNIFPTALDVFAFGMTGYQLITRKPLNELLEIVQHIQGSKIEFDKFAENLLSLKIEGLPDAKNHTLLSVIATSLSYSPNDRYSFDKIFESLEKQIPLKIKWVPEVPLANIQNYDNICCSSFSGF